LINEIKSQNEKFKNENGALKIQLENHKSENLSFKTQYEVVKKNTDLLGIENGKLKNDIESYKNEIATCKDKINKMKCELNQLNKAKDVGEKSGTKDKKNNQNSNTKSNLKIEELENKIMSQGVYITQLETQLMDYKNNLAKIEETQIVEYQKLLDESFAKLTEMQNELDLTRQKNNYLENIVKINLTNGANGCDKKCKF
jgi:chromosome segregation ATPase